MDPGTPIYRLLACDLDGTLMGDDTIISPRVRWALHAAQAHGIYVTLATGRGFSATLPFARHLNITVPIICYQGGLIKHPVTGELFHRETMNQGLALQVVETAATHQWHLVVYIGDVAYVQKFRYPSSFYDTLLGLNVRQVNDLEKVIKDNGSAPAKILLVAEKSAADRLEAKMQSRFGQEMKIVRSHELFVEGSPQGVDKGNALRRLAEHLGVSQAQVMAIGDQSNDVSMLAWAGLGVAMASGSEAARAAADWIAPPLSADGAAVAIERFLLPGRGC